MAGNKDVKFTVSADDQATGVLSRVKEAFSSLGEGAKAALEMMGVALTAVGLGEFFKSSIALATEAEMNWARLGNAVENAGGKFGALKPEIDDVVASLAATSTFRQDALIGGLERLTEVSGDATGSIANMSIVVNLAAAKHMDLETAATLVGRVMDGNTTMLKRYGIVIKDGEDAITQLAVKMKGFAETEANTFGGKITSLSNTWKDFREELGTALLSGGGSTSGVQSLIDLLVNLEGWIKANDEQIAEWGTFFSDAIAGVVSVVGAGIDLIMLSFDGLHMMLTSVKLPITALADGVQIACGNIMQYLAGMLNSVAPILARFGLDVDGLVGKLGTLGKAWVTAGTSDFNAASKAADSEWAKLGTTISSVFAGNGAGAPGAAGGGALPPAGTSQAIKDVREELKQLVAEIKSGSLSGEALSTSIADWKAKASEAHLPTKELNAALKELNATAKEVDAWKKLQEQFETMSQATANAKPKWEAFANAITKWQEAAEKAHMPAAQMQSDLDKLNGTLQQLKDSEATKAFGDLMVKMMELSGDAIDKQLAALDKEIEGLKKQAAAIADPAQKQAFLDYIDYYEQLKDRSIAFSDTLANSATAITAFGEKLKEHDGDMAALSADVDAASAEVGKWTAATKDATLGAADHQKAVQELAKWMAILTQTTKDYDAAAKAVGDESKAATDAKAKHTQEIIKAANEYSNLARSAIAAGQATGQFSAVAAATLQNVVSLADGVAKLFAAMGNPASAGGFAGAGGIGAIVSVVTSFAAIGASIEQTSAMNAKAAQQFADANIKWQQSFDQLLASFGATGFDKLRSALAAQFQTQMDKVIQDAATAIQNSPAATFGASGVGLLGSKTGTVPGAGTIKELDAYIAQLKAAQGSGKNVAQDRDLATLLAQLEKLDGAYKTQAADLEKVIAVQQAAFQQDLKVRELTAEGDTAAAAALQRKIDEQKQLDAAKAAGYDDATLALLKQVQAEEDAKTAANAVAAAAAAAAAAQQKQAAAAQAVAAAAAAAAAAMESLAVRDLRATGHTAEANLRALQDQQAAELQKAIDAGSSHDYIENLKKTLADEMAQFLASQTPGTVGSTAVPAVAAAGGSGSLAGAVPSTSSAGLAGSAYAQTDTTNSLLLAIRNATVDIRGWLLGGGRWNDGPMTATIGQIGPINVYGVQDAAGAQAGAAAGVDQALGMLRMNLRAAAGVPKSN